jgi:hypothetical protein
LKAEEYSNQSPRHSTCSRRGALKEDSKPTSPFHAHSKSDKEPKEKQTFPGPKLKCGYNIKTDVKNIRYEDDNWINSYPANVENMVSS